MPVGALSYLTAHVTSRHVRTKEHFNILSENLDDSADNTRETRYLLHKALCTFLFADPFVLCSLIKSFCLSLYGVQLWDLSRRIWNLPFNFHAIIVHYYIY